ncbi:MAG: Bax inhibitor-1/YccA family protein [Acholeplasmatales bacterium]|nr:Bax inhibitor-1/YccA family protein [Acholeplasmatales bacterium]
MRPGPLFSTIRTGEACYDEVERASYKGIGIKTFVLLGIAVVVAIITALYLPVMLQNNPTGLYAALVVSAIVGTISVFVGRMSYNAAKYAGVIYVTCEGLFLGTLTAIVEAYAPGIATIAIFSTLIIYTVMAILFFTGILRVGNKLRGFILGFSMCTLSLVLFISIFTLITGPIQNFGLLLLIEMFLLAYGIFVLMLDFDEARYIVNSGAEKNAEWSVALGMSVTLIYIYVRVLRFLLIVLGRRD